MGGKRVAKNYWSYYDLVERCKGKSDEEVAALQAAYNKMHNIDPADYHPPEEADRRFKTALRAAMFIPPADEAERQLREQIAKELGAQRQ